MPSQTKPIVDSVYDIPNVTGLQITVDRNQADNLISVGIMDQKLQFLSLS